MKIPDIILEIQTLGRFSISVYGKPVTADWPNETLKELFCSLLSPLDLYISWDRICRSMLGVPDSLSSRRHMVKILIQPLDLFLIKELGFNPVITGHEGIRIDRQHTQVDVFEFHSSAIEGLRLLSLGCHAAALKKLNRANLLYVGSYLPGFTGKIIVNTRIELEAFYQATVMQAKKGTADLLSNKHLPVI